MSRSSPPIGRGATAMSNQRERPIEHLAHHRIVVGISGGAGFTAITPVIRRTFATIASASCSWQTTTSATNCGSGRISSGIIHPVFYPGPRPPPHRRDAVAGGAPQTRRPDREDDFIAKYHNKAACLGPPAAQFLPRPMTPHESYRR